MKQRFSGVLILLGFGCALLVATEVRRSLEAKDEAEALAKRNLENVVSSLTSGVEATFQAAEASIATAEKLLTNSPLTRENAEHFHEVLATAAAKSSAIRAIRVIDAQGRTLISSWRQFPDNAALYDQQPAFIRHREQPGSDIRIGSPERGVKDPAWLIPVTRRMDNWDGSFAGIIGVSLNVEYFRTWLDKLDVGNKGAVSLQTTDGVFLLRRPYSEQYLGLNASDGALFKEHIPKSRSGTYLVKALADSEWRYVSYRVSDKLPIVVAAALSREEVLAPWHRSTRRNGLLIGAVVLAFAAVGAAVMAQLRRRAREAEAAAAEHRLAKAVFDNTPQGILVTDSDNRIVAANPAFTQITGYGIDEIRGRNPKLLSSGRQDKDFYERLWEALRTNDIWSGELWNRRKSGDVFPERATFSRIHDSDGSVVNHVAIFADITQQKAAEEEIHKLAFIDPLTGLANRRLGMDRLQALLGHAHREQRMTAVMLLDLDHFKEINDTRGHAVGDAVLVEVSRRLTGIIRQDDVLARLGGDEFIMGLGGLEEPGSVVRTAERITSQLQTPIRVGQEEFQISSSLGIAMFPGDAADLPTLIQYADQAMYEMKANGRSGFRYFSKEMHQRALAKSAAEERVRKAVASGAFQLHFQPQFDLRSNRITGVEALIRAKDPGLGGPAQFIPMCEQLGIMSQVGEFTLAAACRQARLWRDAGDPIQRIAINVSAQQFADDALPRKIAAALGKESLPAEAIEVEVTESAAMADAERTTKILREIRELGVRIAIDDFGTGYSSLAYLRNFPVHLVKIDRAFVTGIEANPEDLELVRAVVSLCDALGLDTLAEGIETEGQHRLLMDAGCEQGQGYLFGRPALAEQLTTSYAN